MNRAGERPEFVTMAEAGRMLRISPRTISRWVDAGRLACVITPEGRRLRRTDVERMAAEMPSEAKGDPPPEGK